GRSASFTRQRSQNKTRSAQRAGKYRVGPSRKDLAKDKTGSLMYDPFHSLYRPFRQKISQEDLLWFSCLGFEKLSKHLLLCYVRFLIQFSGEIYHPKPYEVRIQRVHLIILDDL